MLTFGVRLMLALVVSALMLTYGIDAGDVIIRVVPAVVVYIALGWAALGYAFWSENLAS